MRDRTALIYRAQAGATKTVAGERCRVEELELRPMGGDRMAARHASPVSEP